MDQILSHHTLRPIKLGSPEIEPVEESGRNFVSYQNIPVSGDIYLLEFKSAYSGSIPAGHVSSCNGESNPVSSIRVKVNIEGSVFDDPVDIYDEIAKTLRENTEAIHKIVEYVNKEIAGYNENLVDVIKPEIETRRRRLRNAKNASSQKSDEDNTGEVYSDTILDETEGDIIGMDESNDYISETSSEEKIRCPLAKKHPPLYKVL